MEKEKSGSQFDVMERLEKKEEEKEGESAM